MKVVQFVTFCTIIWIFGSSNCKDEAPLTHLYDESDGVVILDHSNFDSVIFGSKSASLVVWYVSWCGHCVAFAPRFKRLARDVVTWRNIVRLSAVNCADRQNVGLCRKQSVSAYPTIRFYSPFSPVNSTGRDFLIIEQTTESMRRSLIHYIIEFIRLDWRSRTKLWNHWPDLFPLNITTQSELIQLIENHNKQGNESILFVIEGPPAVSGDSSLQVTLDLSSYRDWVIIYRLLYHSSNLRKIFASSSYGVESTASRDLLIPDPESEITQYPLLVWLESATDQQLSIQVISSSHDGIRASDVRQTFVNAIIDRFLKDVWNEPLFMPSSGDEDEYDEGTSDQNQVSQKVKHPASEKVYSIDLHNAIRYSLYQETLLHQALNASQTKALRLYLHALTKYFPFFDNETQRRWIKKLYQWIKQRNETTATSLNAAMKISAEGMIFPLRPYVSCQDSRPDPSRHVVGGYPCSLWLLFHTLTFQEYHAMVKDPSLRPMVLKAMREYVRHFFTCRYCSQEFEEASRDLDESLVDTNSSVMWLWRAHNDVNVRVAKTANDHLKLSDAMYPSQELCPACRESGTSGWREDEVFQFLQRKYERRNLIRRLPSSSHSVRWIELQITPLFYVWLLLTFYDFFS